MDARRSPKDYLITSVTVAEWICVPLVPLLVPLMVTEYVPLGVDGEVQIFSVDVPDPETAAGLNDGVVPAGNPLTARLTESVKPLSAPIVTV